MKASYKYLLLTGFLLFAASCSVEKNTATTRLYHSVTARYNIYFNGNESFNAGMEKVNNNYIDDYAEMLHLFEYSDPESVSVCTNDMDNAILKASKLIRLKSITALPEEKERQSGNIDPDDALLNRKEYNEWVDDAYLLIGKAHFYKHAFDDAYSVFTYCIEEANDEEIRKEAEIWNARVFAEKGDYNNANRLLGGIDFSENLPKRLREIYYTTWADLYIKQKQYTNAIDPLQRAIGLTRGKRSKYRYTFLLAQLNQEIGNGAEAVALYRKVVRMNPPYEVEFNAQINTASALDAGSNDVESTRRILERMLRDSKNDEYHDQIYFALGNLSIKEGNINQAIDYYKRSVSIQSSNTNQKGRSYLALANYYYNNENLMKAGTYYDSAVFFLNQRYPEYESIRSISDNLNTVVSELRVIQEQDSLQRIASMTETERNNFINNIIAEITEAERELEVTGSNDQYNLGQFYENERRIQDNIEQEGNWYFYNQTALSFGRTEFRRLYGNRSLEDNWRRSNKSTMAISPLFGDEEDEEIPGEIIESTEGTLEIADNKRPEYYLRDLPLTDSLLAISNNKIANAYLNAGKAYAEKFGDPVTSSEYLEMLVIRFPGHQLIPEALYSLYQINKETNNSKAETFRQRLLEEYPETDFALILSDPNYFLRREAEAKHVGIIYEMAYNLYVSGDLNGSIQQCNDALISYPEDILAPKFMLLRAFCYAGITDERKYKEELGKVIADYPGTEEGIRAREIVAHLNQEMPELRIEEDIEIAQELYVKNLSANHLFALIIESPTFNINLANFDVISYNIDNYTNNNYRTQGELANNKYIIITVSGFADYQEAFNYYSEFNVTGTIRNSSSANIYAFLIDDNNLSAMKTDQNPERYLLFFRENYLP